jgi:hypothetical protein
MFHPPLSSKKDEKNESPTLKPTKPKPSKARNSEGLRGFGETFVATVQRK